MSRKEIETMADEPNEKPSHRPDRDRRVRQADRLARILKVLRLIQGPKDCQRIVSGLPSSSDLHISLICFVLELPFANLHPSRHEGNRLHLRRDRVAGPADRS